jgi:acetylornithine deacetylase/succinyl-diaminopimelate desuccinylase-like protein
MIAAIHGPARTSMLLLTLSLATALSWPTATHGQQLSREELKELTEQQFDAAIELYREFLSLPNDAHFPDDMRVIVDWLDSAFRLRGFATMELPTAGLPLLLATREFPGAERTVLFYLQSDGQPVSPEHWRQEDPYGPVLKEQTQGGEENIISWDRLDTERNLDWRVFARSASDSKGPVTQFLSALDAMDRHGFTPDFNIKVIVDTEEELGSPNLPPAVERFRNELAADMLVILDGPPHISNAPRSVCAPAQWPLR